MTYQGIPTSSISAHTWAATGVQCISRHASSEWVAMGKGDPSEGPGKDVVYTIDTVSVFAGVVWLHLLEFPNPDLSFEVAAFRPVRTISQDAALFSSALHVGRVPVPT